MSNQWHYIQDGAQYGPVDEAKIIRLIQSGDLPTSTFVCQAGDKEWLPACVSSCFKVEIYPKKRPSVRSAVGQLRQFLNRGWRWWEVLIIFCVAGWIFNYLVLRLGRWWLGF